MGNGRAGCPAGDRKDRRAVTRIRWRLWHGQAGRALALTGATLANLDGLPTGHGATAKMAAKLVRGLETCVAGLAGLMIDHAAARLRGELVSTATTKGTVQRLLHRRMGANRQMRWSPRGALPRAADAAPGLTLRTVNPGTCSAHAPGM